MDEKIVESAAAGLVALLPGFVSAWIFYGLTPHKKPDKFERVVQAFVFTFISQGIVAAVRFVSVAAGFALRRIAPQAPLFEWSADGGLIWSLLIAVALGFILVYYANNGKFHRWLRNRNISNRTSHPSEWYNILKSACHDERRRILFHLTGNRRLEASVEEWPDQADAGHFILADCQWILDNNDAVALHKVWRLVLPAIEVEMMEIEKRDDEVTADIDQINEGDKKLLDLQTKSQEQRS